MTQKTSALETCETSAIGRALANAGYSGSKRVTREEMSKVQRGVTPPKQPTSQPTGWTETTIKEREQTISDIANATDKEVLREIWAAFADRLDWEFTNSLGDTVTLKQLLMSRVEDLGA